MSVLIVKNNFVDEAQAVLTENNIQFQVEESLGHAFVKEELIDAIELNPNFNRLTDGQINDAVERIMNQTWADYDQLIQEESDNLLDIFEEEEE